jgi:hypothetical protein
MHGELDYLFVMQSTIGVPETILSEVVAVGPVGVKPQRPLGVPQFLLHHGQISNRDAYVHDGAAAR